MAGHAIRRLALLILGAGLLFAGLGAGGALPANAIRRRAYRRALGEPQFSSAPAFEPR